MEPRIAFRVRGSGPSLVLLNHVGASGEGWRPEFLAELEERFELVLVDHRGTGESDKPDSSHSLPDLARDVLAVLEATGIATSHVLGLSMGGAVARELVLAAPERVGGLVLVSTFCGSRRSVPPDPAILKLLETSPGASRSEQIEAMLPAYYSRAFIEKNADLLIRLTARATSDTPARCLALQGAAIQAFDSLDRLGRIRRPTLVIHGDLDPIIPVENGRILAREIPKARLAIVRGVGHVPMTERPVEVAALVSDFLLSLPSV